MASECRPLVALVGPPNSGKTSLFNALTGRAERVSNWPGTTVDVHIAEVRVGGSRVCIADLPGTYSIVGASLEERVTRDFILHEEPDGVVVTVDPTAPVHGLVLLSEVAELHPRVAVVVTKVDAVRGVNLEGLSSALGAPVVGASAFTGEGLDRLIEVMASVREWQRLKWRVDYGELEDLISKLESLIARYTGDPPARGLAVALLAGVEWARREVESRLPPEARSEVLGAAEEARREAAGRVGDVEGYIASRRFEAAEELASRYFPSAGGSTELSKLDRLLINPILGPIIGLLMLAVIFAAVFTVNTGFPLNLVAEALGLHSVAEALEEYSLAGIIQSWFQQLAGALEPLIPSKLLAGLICEGVIVGVGVVVSFAPLIAMVFAALAALEDSGLLPRLAVAFDPITRVLGVSGRAVFPTLVAMGCNVPAVAASRVESGAARRALIFAIPFVPCQARLVVMLAIAQAVAGSPAGAAALVLLAYAVAFAVYAATLAVASRLMRARLGGYEPVLAIVQPPLKKPSLKVVWWHTWENLKHFLEKAGTVIVAASVAIWFVVNYTPSLEPAANPAESIAAALGRAVAPLISWALMVGPEAAWRLAFTLITGLAAKEVVLDSLLMLAPVKAATLSEALASYGLSLGQWVAFTLLVTLYMPCAATAAAMAAESRSWRLAAAAVAYSILVAITVAAVVARIAAAL